MILRPAAATHQVAVFPNTKEFDEAVLWLEAAAGAKLASHKVGHYTSDPGTLTITLIGETVPITIDTANPITLIGSP